MFEYDFMSIRTFIFAILLIFRETSAIIVANETVAYATIML